MKKIAVFAAAVLTAGFAFADSGLTREQVLNDLAQARASGELARLNSDDSASFMRTPSVSTKTRAQVLAELNQARASGELARLNSDDSSIFLRSPSTSTLTRAQVLAELKRAQDSGELAQMNRDPSHTELARATPKAQAAVLAE